MLKILWSSAFVAVLATVAALAAQPSPVNPAAAEKRVERQANVVEASDYASLTNSLAQLGNNPSGKQVRDAVVQWAAKREKAAKDKAKKEK